MKTRASISSNVDMNLIHLSRSPKTIHLQPYRFSQLSFEPTDFFSIPLQLFQSKFLIQTTEKINTLTLPLMPSHLSQNKHYQKTLSCPIPDESTWIVSHKCYNKTMFPIMDSFYLYLLRSSYTDHILHPCIHHVPYFQSGFNTLLLQAHEMFFQKSCPNLLGSFRFLGNMLSYFCGYCFLNIWFHSFTHSPTMELLSLQ